MKIQKPAKSFLIFIFLSISLWIFDSTIQNQTTSRIESIPKSQETSYNYKGVYNFTEIEDGTIYFDWDWNLLDRAHPGQGQVINAFNQHAKVYQVIGSNWGTNIKIIPIGTCPNTGQQIIECYMTVNKGNETVLSICGVENSAFGIFVKGSRWYSYYAGALEEEIDTNSIGVWVYVKYIMNFNENIIKLYLDNSLECTINGFLSSLGGIKNVIFGGSYQQPVQAYIDSFSYTWFPGYNEGDLLIVDSPTSSTTTASFLTTEIFMDIGICLGGGIIVILTVIIKKYITRKTVPYPFDDIPLDKRESPPSTPTQQNNKDQIGECICPFCGKRNTIDSTFCYECGSILK